MKKFTNLDEIKELNEINPKINKLVEKLVSLNLSVSYHGPSDDILGKDVNINGVEKLIEKLETIKENEVSSNLSNLADQLKYSSITNNQDAINKQIDILHESKHDTIIYSPEDIFDTNDYTKSNKLFVIESLNSIPHDYLSKINKLDASHYFENGNTVSIVYEGVDKGWNMSFNSSNDYGTLTDENSTKYNYFIKENNIFIGDFVSATSELIGAKNLKLENRLIK